MNIDRQFQHIIFVLLFGVIDVFSSDFALAEISVVGGVPELVPKIESASLMRKSSFWVLTAGQWEIARNGESVLSLASLHDVVKTWLSDTAKLRKNGIIEIQYPSGEEGEFWVQELTDWFVALGIPSRSLLLVPGSVADEIKFRLNRP